MIGSTKAGKFQMSGCGVAIAPGWVIGVAHIGGDTFMQEGKSYRIAKKIIHKAASGEPADLALYKLEGKASHTVQVASLGFPQLKNEVVYLAGYGQTATERPDGKGWEPVKGSEGTLRIATNRIDLSDAFRSNIGSQSTPRWKSTRSLAYDLDKPGSASFSTVGTAESPNEGGVGAKDSGGGWFINKGGKFQLVAVSLAVAAPPNRGIPNKYGYGAVGIGVDLSAYREWINGQIRS
jgi:hypothetical protein